MAKLIYSGITSLDGYVADDNGNFDWAEPDEEVHTFVNGLERRVRDLPLRPPHVRGDGLWGDRASPTPSSRPSCRTTQRYGRRPTRLSTSKTLETVSSAKARIDRHFDPDAVQQLKASEEGDISVGGPTSPPRRSGPGWSTNSTSSSRPSQSEGCSSPERARRSRSWLEQMAGRSQSTSVGREVLS